MIRLASSLVGREGARAQIANYLAIPEKILDQNWECHMIPTAQILKLTKCPVCGCSVRSVRLERHLQKVHPSRIPTDANKAAAGQDLDIAAPTPRQAAHDGKSQQVKGVTKTISVSLFEPAFWGRPIAQGAVLQRLHVVGPYPTEGFFRRVRESLDPRELLLVVDDGCNLEEIEKIRQLFENRDVRVRYASCLGSGLVHAKLYLAEWESSSATATIKHLVWGSANASLNGFEVNAEAVSCVTLDSAPEDVILQYFRKLWETPIGQVQPVNSLLPGAVRLLLPGYRFSSEAEPETFDAWIQSGRLCHKYEPDRTFARLSLNLKRPLPQDHVQHVFTDAGLRAETDSQNFRYAYLGGDLAKKESPRGPPWRAQFFLESWLGFWTSDACYRHRRDEFCAQNEEQRKEILDEISGAKAADHQRWTDDFLTRLRRVLAGLEKEGLKPKEFLHIRNRDIDVSHYREDAKRRLESHRSRAQNQVFQDRFTKGYVFPPLPRFRGAEAVEGGSFEDLVHSLCESILNGLTKQRCKSLLIRAIREQLNRLRIQTDGMTGEELNAIFKRHWPKIGPVVKAFYK
jgi:hypothetical protein